jgi:hypothetical protein
MIEKKPQIFFQVYGGFILNEGSYPTEDPCLHDRGHIERSTRGISADLFVSIHLFDNRKLNQVQVVHHVVVLAIVLVRVRDMVHVVLVVQSSVSRHSLVPYRALAQRHGRENDISVLEFVVAATGGNAALGLEETCFGIFVSVISAVWVDVAILNISSVFKPDLEGTRGFLVATLTLVVLEFATE